MIILAATFVAEPLEKPLTWLLKVAGVKEDIGFAPYNQIFQQLLNPNSDLRRNTNGIGVILVRIEDFIRDLADPTRARETIEQVTLELADAFEKFARQSNATLVLCVLPPGPGVQEEHAAVIIAAGESLVNRASQMPSIQTISGKQIEAVSSADPYDSVRDKLAHIPYTDTHFAALALAIARRIHAIRIPAAKVLVLDCDNTLWRGVVGEDGVDGIQISRPYLALQEFAVAQQAKGVLICLASKNAEADVLEVLEKRTDMQLNSSHIVSHRINWQPKPGNIRAIAAELNLGLDAFVFLDDNPIECAQMRSELPQVVTLQIPAELEISAFLEHLWVFDKVAITVEDAARTRMYRENSARRAMESSVADIGQFLAALDLKIDIAAPAESEWARVAQLTQRTNQFNFTTRRRTGPELQSIIADGGYVLRVRVSDRFGDYGLVGVIVALREGTTLLVDTMLLSCRVLGRGVEHAMLRRLGELGETLDLQEVSLPYIATVRNVPARAFAASVAGDFAEPSPEGTLFRMPTSFAASTIHQPGHDPIEIIDARIAEEKKGAGTVGPAPGVDRSDRYSRLANVLVSGQTVLDEMAASARTRRTLDGEATAPATPTESDLLQIWEKVFGMQGIGVEDDFFALGGTSLLSVELFADIARRFHVQLRLTAILDASTVRSLALLIAPSAAQERAGLVCLRRGGAQTLFLVHDGLGETLLYLNLARRLPETLTVYGIEPKRLPGIPLAHGCIEDMASYYVNQIRAIQAEGPYLLGGMCAGGVIAYEMAACLKKAGQSVQMVIILDGATPKAEKRIGRVTKQRLSRWGGVLASARGGHASVLSRWLPIALAFGRKACNVFLYEASSLAVRVSVRLRIVLLKRLIKRGSPWPAALPELSVMQIYNTLESRYSPPKLTDVPVLLVRASVGNGADTPYRELYGQEDFGWREIAAQLNLVDVDGGHSSMLQEEKIDSLASAILKSFPILSTPILGLRR